MKRALVTACLCAAVLGGIAQFARERPQEQALLVTGPGVDELKRQTAVEQAAQAQAQAYAEAFRAGTAEGLTRQAEAKAAREAAARRAAQQASRKAAPRPRAPQAPRPQVQVSGDLLDRLAACESGGGVVANINPRAVSKSRKYWGAFQFSLTTWHNFRPGNPIDYSYEDQKAVVRDNIPVSSWKGQFPTCARRIGVA